MTAALAGARRQARRAGVAHLQVAAASARREAPRPGIGRQVAEGEVLSLRASADGAQLAFLQRCQPVKDRTLPPGTASCELWVVPAAGGAARRIATGVTTLPHGFGWSGEGHALAALAGYDHAEGLGGLVVWSGREPRRIAEHVGYYSLDRPGARAGWVAEGKLFVAPVEGGAPAPVAGADYQPSNVVFALFPPLEGRHRGKAARKGAYAERARAALEAWL